MTTATATKPPETEFSMNVGLQFGLTDVTSDTALKFQGSARVLAPCMASVTPVAVLLRGPPLFWLDGMDLRQPFNRQPC